MAAPATHHQWPQQIRQPDWQALTGIYQEGVNLAVYQRATPAPVDRYVHTLLRQKRKVAFQSVIEQPEALPGLLPPMVRNDPASEPWLIDMQTLAEAWFCLFDAKSVGVRLQTLDRAMCPRFHVDRVMVRMITTYGGPGTQWLPNEGVDRSLLGKPAPAGTDPLRQNQDAEQLNAGDIALMKGELWPGNEGNGLVHRSPEPEPGHCRLLLTFDWVA